MPRSLLHRPRRYHHHRQLGSGGFHPSQLNGGDSIWIDFSDAASYSLVSGKINSITSKTNPAYVYTAVGSSNRPTPTTLGGIPVADFDGSANYLGGNTAVLDFLRGKTGGAVCVMGAPDNYTGSGYGINWTGGATSAGTAENRLSIQYNADHWRGHYKRQTETHIAVRGTAVNDRIKYFATTESFTSPAYALNPPAIFNVDHVLGTCWLMYGGVVLWEQSVTTGTILDERASNATIGSAHTGSLVNGKQFQCYAQNAPMTKEEGRQLTLYFSNMAKAYSGFDHYIRTLGILFGNSIIEGSANASMRARPHFKIHQKIGCPPWFFLLNEGVGGSGVENIDESLMASMADKETLGTAPSFVTTKFMLTASGTNNLAGGTSAAAVKALLDTHLASANALNLGQVNVFRNVIPRTTDVTLNNSITAYNASISTSDGWAAVSDMQSNAEFNDPTDTTNLTFYDALGVHATEAGEDILSVTTAATLTGLGLAA